MIEFFKYKSVKDKNNFLLEEVDQAIFNSLPLDLRKEIYTKFVYQKFLRQFSKFLSLHKQCSDIGFTRRTRMKIEIIRQDNSDLKAHVRKSNQIVSCGLEYPYYTFEDKDYSDFII